MTVLILEPFYGGSHKQLIDALQQRADTPIELIVQTDKKWHWRARASALWFSQKIPEISDKYSHLFTSSVLNLCELIGLRPDLLNLRHGIAIIRHFFDNAF